MSLTPARTTELMPLGLVNVTDPAAPGLEPGSQSYNIGMIASNVDQYLFWDTLHPTAAAHALLGQQVLVIVPEPASFIQLGFGGLLLISGRRMAAWCGEFLEKRS